MQDKKNFVIINTHFIGDNILTNSLVQNIKRIYENSNVIMVVPPYMEELAKYLKDVDDVVVWDRFNKDRGFWNTIKFAFNFPYKNIYAAFPIYGTDRPVIISKLLGAKYTICGKQKFFSKFRNSKYPFLIKAKTIQSEFLQLLNGLTKEKLQDVPNILNIPHEEYNLIKNINDYIVIIPTSTRKSKEIPIETIVELINNLKNRKIVFIGSGDFAKDYSSQLAKYNFENLIDITNKTNLTEAATIIKNATAVVSSDTGLMHISCALQKPTVALFFEKFTKSFIPDRNLYNCVSIVEDYNIDIILNSLAEVTNSKEYQNV